MNAPQFRDDVAPTLAWVGAGSCWAVQLFLPWTTSGPLSSSSQVDGFRLLRSGAISSVAPPWSAYLLLVVPAVGLLVLALGAVDGSAWVLVRTALAVLGAAAVVAGVAVLADSDPTRLGPGGWVAVGGVVVAIVAALLDRVSRRRATRRLAPTPT